MTNALVLMGMIAIAVGIVTVWELIARRKERQSRNGRAA